MTAASSPVLTVPAHASFVDALARGLLAEVGGDQLKLSDYTLLVPDRATAQALRQAFIKALDGKPALMPHIDAPGDLDDDMLSLRIAGDAVLSQVLMDLPPPVTRLERQLILATEIMKIEDTASSVEKAISLAGELGHFIDQLQQNGIELANLEALVPEEFRAQWQKSAGVLKIITEIWPKKLQEMGRIDPEDHRAALTRIQAAHMLQYPPQRPVIAAGFTRADPATLSLLQAVAASGGRVLLPGLDRGIDRDSWDALTPVHPQFMFKKMLDALGADYATVAVWQSPDVAAAHARSNDVARTVESRAALLREALRPAATAEGWSGLIARAPKKPRGKKAAAAIVAETTAIDPAALSGLDLIIAGTPQEEASVIALKMRETLETPGKTAMLVTADRSLARRVAARLQTWNISVADSAGTSLAETPAGIYLLSVAQMAADRFAPIPFLQALKHPLASLGVARKDFRADLAALEKIIRGPRPAPGTEGLRQTIREVFNRAAHRPDQVLTPDELKAGGDALLAFVDRIEAAGKPFLDKMSGGTRQGFGQWLEDHILFCEALAADDQTAGAARLWRGNEGAALSRFLARLRESTSLMPPVTGADYLGVLYGLLRGAHTPPPADTHPRLSIVTPQQALLVKADVMIAGGVNDDVWPPAGRPNPWLSPDMVKALGLPAADEVIGAAAHQFVQVTSNPDALVTRAARSANAPAVVSPLLSRLLMVLKGAGLEGALEGKTRLLDIHHALHTPASVTPCDMPAPTPPAAARPKKLPVTAVEAHMRDPYTIYAKYILGLRQVAPLDASPSVAEKGNYTHAALDEFVRKYPDKMPDNAYDVLLDMGRAAFRQRLDEPGVRAFWWPRFERIAKWFVRFEAERREMSRTLGTEVRGSMEVDLGDGTFFTLTAIADRIDRGPDDKLQIIDYKTGAVPSQKAVALGFSPQMTLEALIAFSGGFKGIEAQDVSSLQYWKLSGGRPAADVIDIKADVGYLVEEARKGLYNLIKTFSDPNTPYLPVPHPDWAPRYQAYAHLSRIGEWGTVQKSGDKKAAATNRRAAGGRKGPK